MKYWRQVHLAYAVKSLKYFPMKYSTVLLTPTVWEMAFRGTRRYRR